MKPVGERSSLTWWSRAPTQPNWRVPPPLTRFPWCTPPTEVTRDDDRAVLPVRSPGGDDRVPGVGRVVALGRPGAAGGGRRLRRSEEHTSELQARFDLVCRRLLGKTNVPTGGADA